MMNGMPTVLYLAGYSRSGSTIMDMVLGSHPSVASTGELANLLTDAANRDRICTCGARYRHCSVYGDWLTQQQDRDGLLALVRETECRSNLPRLHAEDIPADKAARYRAYARSLFGHIAERTGASIVVDSSKSARDSAGRALALARLAGLDVRVLHLSRDPRSTVRSYLEKGSNWVLEGRREVRRLDSWRPILGWHLANRIAAGYRETFPGSYMHLRFEDLLANPAGRLTDIGKFAGVDLSDVAVAVTAGEAFVAGHHVGGNRTRLKPQSIDLKQPSQVRLTAVRELALRLLTGSTQRRLGYRRTQ